MSPFLAHFVSRSRDLTRWELSTRLAPTRGRLIALEWQKQDEPA